MLYGVNDIPIDVKSYLHLMVEEVRLAFIFYSSLKDYLTFHLNLFLLPIIFFCLPCWTLFMLICLAHMTLICLHIDMYSLNYLIHALFSRSLCFPKVSY